MALIVHLSNTPVAGAPLALAEAISHASEHCSFAVHRKHFRWTPDLDIERVENKQLRDIISDADVIHCHGNFSLHHGGQHKRFTE